MCFFKGLGDSSIIGKLEFLFGDLDDIFVVFLVSSGLVSFICVFFFNKNYF